MNTKKTIISRATCAFLMLSTLNGCWLAAGAVGAEGGYVASQDKRTTGETIDDQLIVASIKTKLVADPDTSAFDINVDSSKGNVVLKGYVSTHREMDRALEIARGTSGVVSVKSKMVLDS